MPPYFGRVLLRLKNLALGLIDQVIPEPLGGAHRDYDVIASSLKQVLSEKLAELQAIPISTLVEQRYQRLISYGLAV